MTDDKKKRMDNFIRQLCFLAYDRFLAVLLSIIIAAVLGNIIVQQDLFNAHQLGIISSAMWICSAIYLRFVAPYRDVVPYGLTAFFYFAALCILGSTGMHFLPEELGRQVQASAYVAFGLGALLALAIIIYAIHEEPQSMQRLQHE